jgi:hypothetical protein
LALFRRLRSNAVYPFNDPLLPMEKRIDNLLSLMTIDEKVNCLSTNTGVPRLGVMSYGSSESIHGVVQREARGTRLVGRETSRISRRGRAHSRDDR